VVVRSRSAWVLVLSILLTMTVGVTAFATRDDRNPATPGTAHETPPAPQPSHGPEYVAIGDSFTAGGPIGAIQAGADDCLRSRYNYPARVATNLDLSVTDVSCGGATTADALKGSDAIPPQVAAVTSKAKLVTVSVGGNDHGIYITAFVNCLRYAKVTRVGAPCKANLGNAVASRVSSVQESVSAVLRAVRRRAPHARVMVVTYLRLLPDDAECSALPYPVGDVAWVTQVERSLAQAMRQAAVAQGVEVVDMHELSEGHDACSPEPWVNGLRPKAKDGWFLHPNAAGAKAVADAVSQAWREGPPARR
jgi:lysophospholipase L1-like esterase